MEPAEVPITQYGPAPPNPMADIRGLVMEAYSKACSYELMEERTQSWQGLMKFYRDRFDGGSDESTQETTDGN